MPHGTTSAAIPSDFASAGNLDDISREIELLNKFNKPWSKSYCKPSGTVYSIKHEFETEEVRAAAGTTNAQTVGADAIDPVTVIPDRLVAYCQVFEGGVRVAVQQEKTRHTGYASELGRQTRLEGEGLLRDREEALMIQSSAASMDTPKLTSVRQWVSTNVTDKGDASAMDTDDVGDALQTCHDACGRVPTLWMSKGDLIRSYAKLYTRTISDGRIPTNRVADGYVKVVETDFGPIELAVNRYCSAGDVLLLLPDTFEHFKMNGLNWRKTKLGKTGDNDRWMITGTFGQKCVNELANYLYHSCTT